MPHSLEETRPGETDSIESHRLSAVLQMVSGLAHESHNALQRAHSCLELLELGTIHGDEQHQLIAIVRRSLTDLNQNYERVKAYASPISLTRSLVDLTQLCQTVFDEMSDSLCACKATLKFINGHCSARTLIDSTQMRTVLRHLFDNALAASGPKASIEISCFDAVLREQNAIELHIRDHGTGLDSSIECQLFEPFVTHKQRGAGLGLAVCRRIITTHGGEIDVRNHPEGGVKVRIILPR